MSTTADSPASQGPGSSGALPRAFVLLVALAGAVVIVSGLNAIAFIVGPVFLSLVLTITVYPAQVAIVRRGAPAWVGLLVGFIGVTLILVLIAGAVILALARFGSLIPQYADEARDRIGSLTSQLDRFGVDPAHQKAMSDALDPSQLSHVISDILGNLVSLTSSLFFLITVLLFMTLDAYRFPALLETAGGTHRSLVTALVDFAHGTRTYLVVSTIFGFIVAVIDTIVLALLGIPAPAAWGVLAFVTNYIPNIGFVIGLIPPAALALLEGGPGLMVAVIAAYCVINFIIQSIIQPKFVADAVGLSPTITIVSLVFWAWALGAVGALLAVPLTLFVRALLVDADDRATWLRPLLAGSSAPKPGEPPR